MILKRPLLLTFFNRIQQSHFLNLKNRQNNLILIAMSYSTSVKIEAKLEENHKEILTPDAISFLEKLHLKFEPTRQTLLANRITRQKELDGGRMPDFLESTRTIREGNWKIAPLPKPLLKRRVEITGPVDRKMVINALNSGADCFMADFEDSNTPTWTNQLDGQINLRDAIKRQVDFTAKDTGKNYRLNEETATLLVRPRGWHLDEKHILVNGQRLSGSLFDFGLYFFHNAKELLSRGVGPYFYLPKMESSSEARLWNEVFIFAQNEIGLPLGTIKATCLIEHILAAFEMDEILYELRDHSAGLNAGRWDYIFSCIKKFKNNKDFCLADRSQINMTVPFMRAYALSLIQTCHKRGACAIGGMAALIPIKDNPEANEKALEAVRSDKKRDATDGYDGGWVAHPGLVNLAMKEMIDVLGDKYNQIEKQLDCRIEGKNLLDFRPEGPITENGLRMNISVGLQYLASWLQGTGCVAINNLMEDAATAEISRSQIWQWIHSEKGVLDDGQKVTVELVNSIVVEELGRLMKKNKNLPYDKAATFFAKIATDPNFVEFLTIPLYEEF